MPILARYLVRNVLGYTGLVLLVLLALGALFLFIGQQDDIGTGTYAVTDALTFVALNLPTYLAQLMPVGGLIGALLALGNLARGSELVVMRASGVSTLQFCRWLAVAGIVLALVMVLLGEFVAPPMQKYAKQLKTFSKYSEFSFAGNRGAWIRDGDSILSVDQQSARTIYGGVQVFRFDAERRLLSVGRAISASVDDESGWRLQEYAETRFSPEGAETTLVPQQDVPSSLSPDFLGLAVLEPEAMSLRELRSYIEHLQENELDATHFEIAFWSRTARVLAGVLVVILALPFALGPMRSSGQGTRMVVGILIGAGFVLLSQMVENSGQLFDLPAWVVGWAPTILLVIVTVSLLRRAK